jgi:hypothetical protein
MAHAQDHDLVTLNVEDGPILSDAKAVGAQLRIDGLRA